MDRRDRARSSAGLCRLQEALKIISVVRLVISIAYEVGTMTEYPYDQELSSGGTAPSANDLVKLMISRLTNWLNYLTENPPLDELKSNADQIMNDVFAPS